MFFVSNNENDSRIAIAVSQTIRATAGSRRFPDSLTSN